MRENPLVSIFAFAFTALGLAPMFAVAVQGETVVTPEPPRFTDNRPAAVGIVEPPKALVEQGELLTWKLGVEATFDNPFDPQQVRLDAEIELPDGTRVTVPGFFAESFERRMAGEDEVLDATGETGWYIRFRPWLAGAHRWRIGLTSGGETVGGNSGSFDVQAAPTRGMIRVSPNNPRGFAYDNGDDYVPIGLNLAWPDKPGTFSYDAWFDALEPHGVNFARLWLAPNFNRLALERPHLGVGQLDTASLWKLDYIVGQAEQHGIHLMLCFEAHGGLSTKVNPAWHENPYNAANGGPCAKPTDFWTHPEALQHFRNRLRYVVARYGHSPAVFAWEFWNEVDFTDEDELYIGPIRDWHARMGAYLKSIDPYGHLVTTSGASGSRHDLLDELPELDFVQTHAYQMDDTAEAIRRIGAARGAEVAKPHLFGELGIAHWHDVVGKDREGVHLHNLMWAGLYTDTPATAMSWWWDLFIEKYDLWWHFGPVSKYMAGVPAAAGPTRAIGYENLRFLNTPDTPTARGLRVSGSHSVWQPHPSNKPHTLRVRADGQVDGVNLLSGLLHGKAFHSALDNPVTFVADYPNDGTFTVHVTEVSGWGGSTLRIRVDDEIVLEEVFEDTDGRSSKEPITDYNGAYHVEVPAGRRRITVENPGIDWMRVSYSLLGPVTDATPWLDIHTRALDAAKVGEPAVLAWFRNRDSVWGLAITGEPIRPVSPAALTLTDIPDGDYDLEWWDTYTGQSTRHGTLTTRNGCIDLQLPTIERDVALRLIRKTVAAAPTPPHVQPTEPINADQSEGARPATDSP